ncbi:MAG: Rrf2 family transcriptional regulator [Bacillota bacterium]|nr:Rrf2 family transcriptional regulator [Bacillota bacterium]
MRLSTRGRYALEAVLALTLCEADKPVSLNEISVMTALSRPYLEHIFTHMKRAGLVLSVRGSQGGYRLAVKPNEITAGQVLRAAEGSLAPVRCTRPDNMADACARADLCRTRPVWTELDRAISSFVDRLTLAALAESYRTESGDCYLPATGGTGGD